MLEKKNKPSLGEAPWCLGMSRPVVSWYIRARTDVWALLPACVRLPFSNQVCPFQCLRRKTQRCLRGSAGFSTYVFSKRISGQGSPHLESWDPQVYTASTCLRISACAVSAPPPLSACAATSKFACVSIQDFCSLCGLERERMCVYACCVCVCVGVDMDV